MPDSTLIPVFADQLSPNLSALRRADRTRDRVLMVEVAEEANRVAHHSKKLAFLFSAMRHHADALRRDGWEVDYVRLDDPDNSGAFSGELARAIARHHPSRIALTEPGEWRVLDMARQWPGLFSMPVHVAEDDRFLCSREEFEHWAGGRRQLRMEYFYREMRKKTGLLMDGNRPEGGRWNFDAENRKPADRDLFMPKPLQIEPDATTRDVLDMVRRLFPDRFGAIEPFGMAVTRDEAERALAHFISVALAGFGDHQDAMLTGERYLYHSFLSAYLNAGLLDPLDICRRVEEAWRDGAVPLNSAEGYIRQIIGWREFVRRIYWLRMPEYANGNFLEARRPLPDFYWNAETDMACIREVVTQTREDAYAHHIQRLMVTGNFALLVGVAPHEVHEWYLAVYSDAFEWVEMPNTLGMSQFADGGVLASKPYAASGNYINRMSDYCSNCRYDVKDRTGPDACPFNPLYWDFLERNREKLGRIPRLAQVYRTWDRMPDETRRAYRTRARDVFARLDQGRL